MASAAVFSYIFTLRGNKAWKQMPVTAGAVKVSPLALAAYEMLVGEGDAVRVRLATQLGKEVTEGAVLRALTELWSQLRVMPVPQQDGRATLWELTTRALYQADQSRGECGSAVGAERADLALSGQAIVATEDEIETFLSPLAPRSRVRDVDPCADRRAAVGDGRRRRQDAAACDRRAAGVCGAGSR